MNIKTLAAWVLAAAFALVAVIAAIAQPLHWKRTVALTVVLAVLSAALALRQSKTGAA